MNPDHNMIDRLWSSMDSWTKPNSQFDREPGVWKNLYMTSTALALYVLISALLLPRISVASSCYDIAVANGSAFKDADKKSLVVIKRQNSTHTLAGVAIRGRYFGCSFAEAEIARAGNGVKKIPLFIHVFPFTKKKDLSTDTVGIRGIEIDYSTEGRKILAGRAVQVPWDIVDRSAGVTGKCAPSTPTAFEGFLYQVLKDLKARRCTNAEITSLVGESIHQQH
jgi:hypothetical protein